MKILVISHNSISGDSNMGLTTKRLLSAFSKEELCQIIINNDSVFSNETPETLALREKDLIRTFSQENQWHKAYANEKQNIEITNSVIKKIALRLLLDTIYGSFSNWKTNHLNDWVNEQKPLSIFLMAGDSTFIYNIALFISEKFELPLFVFYGDDYILDSPSNNIIDNVYNKILFSKIKETSTRASGNVFISDMLKEKYENIFKANGIIIRTPYSKLRELSTWPNKPLEIFFLGNLSLGRYKNVLDIIDGLKIINKNENIISLQIYGPEIQNFDMDKLNTKFSTYRGLITSDEAEKMLEKANFLLHVESFEEKFTRKTKRSLSTKIPNYLASGKPIIAYGPNEVNSIKYLAENDAAIIISDKNEVYNKLLSIPSHNFDNIVQNALKLAQDNHCPIKNAELLKNYIKINKKESC